MFWFFIAWALMGFAFIGWSIGDGNSKYKDRVRNFEDRHLMATELAAAITEEMFKLVAAADEMGIGVGNPAFLAQVNIYRDLIKKLHDYADEAKKEANSLKEGNDE